jgi:hypothetical protein
LARGAALLCFLAAGAAPAQAPAPAAQPAARWHLDGATNRCVLTRRLEGTASAATFILRTIPGSGRYDVILAAPELPRELRAGRTVSVGFAPGGSRHERRLAAIEVPVSLGEAVAIGPFGRRFAGEFAGAATLELSGEGGRAVGSWTIPTAARAAGAFASCEAEKQVDWGSDPAAVEPGATPPRPVGERSAWLRPSDLGMTHVLASTEVAAVFRLVVGADGRATDCTVLESAGNMPLQAGACRILVQRARYEPAKDPRGNAVRSVDVYTVVARTDLELLNY